MLIKRTPDTYEKIQALGGMASDDILSRPGPEATKTAPRAGGPTRLRGTTQRQGSTGPPFRTGGTST